MLCIANPLKILLFMLVMALPVTALGSFREQRLGVVPAGYVLDKMNIIFTPVGDKAAYAVQQGRNYAVVFDGKLGKTYDHIRMISISPDRGSVAYTASPVPVRGGKEFRVVNGIETGPFTTVCNPTFSPDSRLVAFECNHGGREHHAVSAADATRIAGETGDADMHYQRPEFSRDGRLIVSIQQLYTEKKAIRLVSTTDMRKVRSREYDSIFHVIYSADGSRTAYVAAKNGKYLVVESSFAGGDEREGAPYDSITFSPAFSVDGGHIAYGAERGGKWFLVVDSRETPAMTVYNSPVFSPDGTRVAYAGIRDGKWSIVVAGKEGPFFDKVFPPVFSPDGAVVAYLAARQGKWLTVIGETELAPYELKDGWMADMIFAPDGRYVAYRMIDEGKQRMVIADRTGKVVREGALCDEIWQPSFDKEGRLGYGALVGREIWWKLLTLE